MAKAISEGDKREGLPKETPWTKVKLDRQILSVAIVNFASELISDDPDVKAIGDRWNFNVKSIDDLPIPSHLIPPPLLELLGDDWPTEASVSVLFKPEVKKLALAVTEITGEQSNDQPGNDDEIPPPETTPHLDEVGARPSEAAAKSSERPLSTA